MNFQGQLEIGGLPAGVYEVIPLEAWNEIADSEGRRFCANVQNGVRLFRYKCEFLKKEVGTSIVNIISDAKPISY